ncbi:MAG: type II toxin-antitoxin system prevent-host-death family antitoxin [Pseudomonadota bacterium]|nr:type II toxin-antitoxin system prevent-host-death family antitoxin [Pseudomonadota bacterium]
MKTVTAAAADRHFSSVLREVSQGQRVVVTSRGKPVAPIEPPRRGAAGAGGGTARQRLLRHLATVQPKGLRNWCRDELSD